MGRNLFYIFVKIILLFGIKKLGSLAFLRKIEFFNKNLDSIVSILSFLVVVSLIFQFIGLVYRKRKRVAYKNSDNITVGLDNLYAIVLIVSVLYFFLTIAGISVGEFFTSISIVAAAIVLLTKEYLSAIISGFLISFSEVLSLGDIILIDETKGRIKDITLTRTYIMTEDEELMILPNDKVFAANIINYSKGNRRRVSIPFEIALPHLESVDELERSLISEIADYKTYIVKGSFSLRIESIAKDFVSFKFLYTIDRVDSKIESAIRKKTVRRIVDYIKNKSKA